MPNNNEIRPTDKAAFDVFDVYNCFPKDATVVVLFLGMVSVNYWNLTKIFRVVWQRAPTLCSRLRGALLKGPRFWSTNIDIHWENPRLLVHPMIIPQTIRAVPILL
jgi:hypothetical protein